MVLIYATLTWFLLKPMERHLGAVGAYHACKYCGAHEQNTFYEFTIVFDINTKVFLKSKERRGKATP